MRHTIHHPKLDGRAALDVPFVGAPAVLVDGVPAPRDETNPRVLQGTLAVAITLATVLMS